MTEGQIREKIRDCEDSLELTFCSRDVFSKHLVRYRDDLLPDKYDHNFFAYDEQFSSDEYLQALRFQKERKDSFLKFMGREELEDDLDLEKNCILTMYLAEDPGKWRHDDAYRFDRPSLEQISDIEVRHYAKLYGEDFTRRNIARCYGILDYRGVNAGDVLVGSCYTYSDGKCLCIDGLLTDEKWRNRLVATSLLRDIAMKAEGRIVFLHADEDDTPRRMYEKMGFRVIDRKYEYFRKI